MRPPVHTFHVIPSPTAKDAVNPFRSWIVNGLDSPLQLKLALPTWRDPPKSPHPRTDHAISFPFLLWTDDQTCWSNFLQASGNENDHSPQREKQVLRVARRDLINPRFTDVAEPPARGDACEHAARGVASSPVRGLGPRAGDLGSGASGEPAVCPWAVRPSSLAAARVLRATPSAPRRQEASAARPQMSLPLRLPYCYPARRWRGALWLSCICAPVTPPLSPPAYRGSTRSTKAALRRAAWRRRPGPGPEATGGAPRGAAQAPPPRPGVPGPGVRLPRHPGLALCPPAPPLPPRPQGPRAPLLRAARDRPAARLPRAPRQLPATA
ncbi:translation initiation factor IF-2-like [Phocoena sinus]|uniref:translation initiation factor IF-2-like n=1 Tax=Phocoena sinus TaxID=42100 RepID=UPI0013C48C6B|nr:translation initiation factor IF-2-like [Phocoena sinus]